MPLGKGCRYTISLVAFLAPFAAFAHASAQEPASSPPATSADAHLGKGYDALRQDRYQDAATEFKAALAADPSVGERARFPLAVALFEMHQPADARRELEILRHDLGDHPNILYYLGRLDIESDNIQSAIDNLNKAAAKPPFPDTAYYLGFAYLKQHDLADAEKWLNAAKGLIPRDYRVEFQLAKVYREQGRTDEASQAQARSDELRRRDDNDVRLKQECVKKLEQSPREEARAVCQQVYDPDNAERLAGLGTIYGQHGDYEYALKCFKRAAELSPQSPQMQYNLALTYYQLNQPTDARAPLEQSLKRWPDIFQLNALYSAVLVKLGENDAAYQTLHRALELNPQDSGTGDLLYMTTLQLARDSQAKKEYSRSLQYLQEAAKLRPSEPAPHERMAEIYSLTARPAQASAEQKEADRLNKSRAN